MRAEDYLQFQFDFWPELFYSRENLLDHIFCSVGNGLEWRDGEIKDRNSFHDCKDEREDRYVLKHPVERAVPSYLGISHRQAKLSHLKLLMNSDNEFADIYKNDYNVITKSFNSLSKNHSLIYEIPDNVKPDWLDLCIETIGYMKESGIDVSDIVIPDKTILDKK